MKRQIRYLVFAPVMLFLFFSACKSNLTVVKPDPPFNPFDSIDYSNGVIDDIPIDSSSFLGLHTFIFSTTCAVPGCHDGSFEPDYRTVQSAYNTLVYAPVIKNDSLNSFTYRVVPGDTAHSWLYERITTNDATLGRMPLYDTLYPNERQKIIDWILNGAPDVLGNSPVLPNYQPVTFGFVAYANDTLGARLDTLRADIVSPMLVPPATTVEIWFGVYDTDENAGYYPGSSLTYNKARISTDPFYFSAYVEYSMEVEPVFAPFMGPIYFAPTYTGPYYQHFTFNTSAFDDGRVHFIRFYVDDGDHADHTEIPNQGSPYYLLTYFSFIVQ